MNDEQAQLDNCVSGMRAQQDRLRELGERWPESSISAARMVALLESMITDLKRAHQDLLDTRARLQNYHEITTGEVIQLKQKAG